MRHAQQQRTLGRNRSQRTALIRGLATSLIRDEKIVTSPAKAKELRPFIERLITTSKEDSVAARRRVASRLGEPKSDVINKLFADIAPKYKERAGGYTRIIKVGRTDAGRDEAIIELL
jgi:ribosomal protein L17